MDASWFLEACRQVMDARPAASGIGTLREKTLHAALKLYLEPDPLCREVGVGRFVADIVNQDGIIEIQTADFGRLREKLDFFLSAYPVTVVYPVAGRKWLVSVSEEGTMSRRRKSPKAGGPWEILPELYRIRPLLNRPGLGFCVPVLEVEEYRLKDGRGRRGYTRYERMPVRLLDEVWVREPGERSRLLPPGLPEEFTAKDFCRCGHFSGMAGSLGLSAAREMGAVEQVGTKGKAYLYRMAK